MIKPLQFLLFAITAGCLLRTANANPISVFDTGVDGSGTVLANGTSPDPHYSLISVPAGSVSDTLVRTAIGGYPIPPYLGDNGTSAWIGPNNDAQFDSPAGDYVYRSTFDLSGLNALTASIVGQWTSDNDGIAIWLNGSVLVSGPTDFAQFDLGFIPFSISSGFVSGINTLDFVVHNGGYGPGDNNPAAYGLNPTALRVEMSGSANVPDGGSTLTLLGGALAGIAAWRRKFSA